MPLVLTRSATLRGCAALLAALHLTVAAAGPIVHSHAGADGAVHSAWSSYGPGSGRHVHNPSACAICVQQTGGFAPASAQPLALATRVTGVEPPAVPPAPRAVLPQWRILQRPPPSSLMA